MSNYKPPYPALSIIMVILKVFGWSIFILAVIAGLVSASGNPLLLFVSIIVGGLTLLACLASAETIRVLIDIEEHLRKVAYPPHKTIEL